MIYCESRAEAYRALRYRHDGQIRPAFSCWERAKDFGTVGKFYGPNGKVRGGDAHPVYKGSSTMVTWVEHPYDRFRQIESINEICRREGWRLNHRGWYVDSDQNETIHGVVCRLPGRHGKPVFVVGHNDNNNDGPVRLDLTCTYDDLREAVKDADWIAEHAAEGIREYDEAWQAGNQAGEKITKRREIRRLIRKLVAEMKAAKSSAVGIPTICKALRSRLRSARRARGRLAAQIKKLHDEHGNNDGYKHAIADYYPNIKVPA